MRGESTSRYRLNMRRNKSPQALLVHLRKLILIKLSEKQWLICVFWIYYSLCISGLLISRDNIVARMASCTVQLTQKLMQHTVSNCIIVS